MAKENQYDKLRLKCHNSALDCFGYSYIFSKRSERLKRIVTFIKALGVLVPSAVGATALGYANDSVILKDVIYLAVPVGIIQFILSLIAIIYKWDERLSYSYEAIYSYDNLYYKFDKLGNFPPGNFDSLTTDFEIINIERTLRGQQDAQQNIKEWERRKGLKYALREKQKECVSCKEIPSSMESTDCHVCGNYSFKYRYLTFKS